MIKVQIPHQLIRGMSGFAFNSRRDKFKDPKVRQALAYAYDFEWTNKNLFYGLLTRSNSYWGNSDLGSVGAACWTGVGNFGDVPGADTGRGVYYYLRAASY